LGTLLLRNFVIRNFVIRNFVIRNCELRDFVPAPIRGSQSSVPYPNSNPDPSDPHVFGPSGSGSFYQQEKSKKNLV
jgi:hypothetical protein